MASLARLRLSRCALFQYVRNDVAMARGRRAVSGCAGGCGVGTDATDARPVRVVRAQGHVHAPGRRGVKYWDLHTRGMAKARPVFVCSDCGGEHAKWSGQCGFCKEWNTLKEFKPPKAMPGIGGSAQGRRGRASASWQAGSASEAAKFVPLKDIEVAVGQRIRLESAELERVLGGGLTPGSVVLVAGTPGVGKSTLMMQVASMLALGCDGAPAQRVAYVSGEESSQQLKQRADRLHAADDVHVLNETDLEAVMGHLNAPTHDGSLAFDVAVIDSVQTMYMEGIPSSAGSVSQVKACAMQLLQLAKSSGVTVFLVGHVTKSGDIAGPKVLEHLVDTVLYVEGHSSYAHRLVRTAKNRFGSTSEVGVFEMGEQGLVEVDDPAALFVTSRPDEDGAGEDDVGGSVVGCTVEGSRPMCVELQALCTPTPFEFPRHRASGVAIDRVFMLLAVLSRHAKLKPRGKDLFVNVVGGLRLTDPAVDLPLAVAIASSMKEVPVPRDLAFIGEVGLGGELRAVPHTAQRMAAAAQLGFKRCVVPAASTRTGTSKKPRGRALGAKADAGNESAKTGPASSVPGGVRGEVEEIPVRTLRQALAVAFGDA